MQFLQNVNAHQAGTSDSEIAANVASYSGNIFKNSISRIFHFKQITWILENGVTEHMCFDSKIFLELKPLVFPRFVKLTTSFRVKVTQVGNVILNSNIILKNILFVPSFKYNLISIQRLC